MSILSAFTTGIRAATEGVDGYAEVAAGGGDHYFSGWSLPSASGMRVTPHAAKRLPIFFACVSKRATSIAMLPKKLMQDDGKGGRRTASNHPLYRVLYMQPNAIQSSYEFWGMMEAHLCMRGNAFAEIVTGGDGQVKELWPWHPDRVRVEQLQGSGKLRYRYQDPLTNTERVLMQEEVFHRRENADSIGIGQSRIEVGCDALGVALQRQDYTARFMRNDATPGAVFTGANFKTEKDEDDFVDSVVKARTGANAGRPYLLPPGMDVKSLGFTPVQAQLIESGKLSDMQICALMGVYPHSLGMDAGKAATFNSTEEFNLMDVQQRILPQAIALEQDVQRALITDDTFYLKCAVASLMRGDSETRSKYFQALVSIGVICADEVRELEDLPPIPGGAGKRFWNPLNWGLIDRDPATTPPTATNVGVPDEDSNEAASPKDNEGDEDSDEEQAAGVIDEPGGQLVQALVNYSRVRPTGKGAR